MKKTLLRNTLFASLLVAGATLASCKNNNNAGDGAVETNESGTIESDTMAPGNMDDMDMETDTATVNPDTVMGP